MRRGSTGTIGPDGGDPAVVDWMRALETAPQLDVPVARVTRLANRVLPPGPLRDGLRGHRWLGHAVHPLLTDLPLGMWTSALVLDLVGGREAEGAAQRLVGLGVVAAVPTALTGWAEWVGLAERDRRVGLVHAAANATGIALFAGSWRARRAGARRRGIALAVAGSLAAAAGGYLGAHLTEVRKVAGSHPAFAAAAGDTS
ncbi:DUF2231 domain-containing protein [Nocardioides ginsengisoli]